jgi:tetratricopeptide (TPR) repeat protein
MSGRELRLILLISMLIAGVVAFAYQRYTMRGLHSPLTQAQFLEEYEKIRAAEAIEDPLRRCLAYPNPRELHWDAKVVDALCKVAARRYIGRRDVKKALDEHRYAWLDETFEGYAKRNSEPGNHGVVITAYRTIFDNADAGSTAALDKWVEAEPDNAVALTARGYQMLSAAAQARGTRYLRYTADEKLQRMQEFALKARADFQRASKLQPQLIAVHFGSMQAAQLLDDDKLLRGSARHALALDPVDDVVYEKLMSMAQPKWGGSIREMNELAAQARKRADENPLLLRLGTRVMCMEAEENACSGECAPERRSMDLEHYRNAADALPAQCFLRYAPSAVDNMGTDPQSTVLYHAQAYRFLQQSDSVWYRARVLQQLEHEDWAREALDRLVREDPENPLAYVYEGWLANRPGHYADAERQFLKALEREPLQREAITELVVNYSWWMQQPEKAQKLVDRLKAASPPSARAWLLQSEVDHNTPALQKADLEKYLQLVDQDTEDNYELRDIKKAKEHVKEISDTLRGR